MSSKWNSPGKAFEALIWFIHFDLHIASGATCPDRLLVRKHLSRYPSLKKKLYYRDSSVEEATNFHIINYDNDATYPQKETSDFYHN